MAAQLLEHRVGQRLAGGVPAARAEVVLGGVDLGPGRAVTASSTFRPSATTSGPMPSPPMTARLTVSLPVLVGSHVSSLRTVLRSDTGVSHDERPRAVARSRSSSHRDGAEDVACDVSRRSDPARAGPSTPAVPDVPSRPLRSCHSFLCGCPCVPTGFGFVWVLGVALGTRRLTGRHCQPRTRDLRGEWADYRNSPRRIRITTCRVMSSRLRGRPTKRHPFPTQ